MINRQSLEDLQAKYPRAAKLCVRTSMNIVFFFTTKVDDRKILTNFFVQQKFIYQVRFIFWFIIHRLQIHSYYDINFRPFTSLCINKEVASVLLNVLNKKTPQQLVHIIAIADLDCLANNNSEDLAALVTEHIANNPALIDNSIDRAGTDNQVASNAKAYDTVNLDNALQDTVKLLTDNHIDYFLMSGTLLGLVRNKRPLKNDDIDIGLYANKTSFDNVVTLLAEQKVQVEDVQSPYLIKLLVHNVSIDLFFHFEEDSSLWHGSLYHRWYNKNIEHDVITYKNKKYQIPKNYDAYLTENYGDWKTPVSNFSIYLDCPNYAPQINNDALVFIFKNLLRAENKLHNNKGSSNINKRHANSLTNHCHTILKAL